MTTVQELPTASFPPPCPFPDLQARDRSEDSDHNNASPERAALHTNQLPERCQFTFSDGRQCRMQRSEIHPSLCRYHAEREEQLFGEPGHSCVVGAALDLPELYSACRDLSTAGGVNRALAQVFRLLALRRISRQEAATFGHLAQLLLRSISAARAESDHPTGTPDQVVERQKDVVITSLLPHEKVKPERGSDFESRVSLRDAELTPRMPSWRMAPDSSPHTQDAPAPNSQGPQNEHLRKVRLQLEQNEQFQNFET